MISSCLLICLLFAVALAADEKEYLSLGYASRLSPKKDSPCVVYVKVPIGTTSLRIYADKRTSLFSKDTETRLYAGKSVFGQKIGKIVSGTSAEGKEKGDVLLSLETNGIGGDWWILVESDGSEDVDLTAVAYDISRDARVSADFGKRTGVVTVPFGSAEIYRLPLLDGSKEHTVGYNIDAGTFGHLLAEYDVFVTVIDDTKIQGVLDNLSFSNIASFLSKIGNALKSGDLSAVVPAWMSPSADDHDFKFEHRLDLDPDFGKGSFKVAKSEKQRPLVYLSIYPRGGLVTGTLSSFTVGFSLDGGSVSNDVVRLGCQSPPDRRKRDVAAAADKCNNKACGDCVADAECHYCYGATFADGTTCRLATAPCEAPTAPATAPQCDECFNAKSEEACNGVSSCSWCTVPSGEAFSTACTTKWFCETVRAEAGLTDETTTTVATTTSTTGAGAGGVTTVADGPEPASAASSVSALAALLSLALFNAIN